MLFSCQKEIDGLIDGSGVTTLPVIQKPKVGTLWTYRYYWYNSPGGFTNFKIVNHMAVSEETLGSEKWLKITDVETDTVVYFLKNRTDSLYQYANNNAYLFCKYPAAINDTYNTFNEGSVENFTVRGVNDSSATEIGNIPLTKYEGVKTGFIIDEIWYNKSAWIVWKYQYKVIPLSPFPPLRYLYSRMFLRNIVY